MIKQTIKIITEMNCDISDVLSLHQEHDLNIDKLIDDGWILISDVAKIIKDYYNAPEKFCRIATLERMV